MSTDIPTEATGGPHLDGEATSAALDGEATAEETAHLAGCAPCQAGVARLRPVQTAVAAPVALDGAAREAAITAALAAFEPDAAGPTLGDEVAPFDASARRSRRRPTSRRGAELAPWLGLAAVLLLLVLAAPLLGGLGGGDDGDTAATSGMAEGSEEPADGGEAAQDSATAMAAAPAVDVGELGALEPGADLRSVVDGALGPVADEGGRAAGAATITAQDGGRIEAGEAGGSATEEAARSTEQAGACEASVRGELPEAGALLLVGTASVEGDPAFVYGFAAPDERPTVLIALVRADGCGLVTFQSYARG